jgi:hypothetical protein
LPAPVPVAVEVFLVAVVAVLLPLPLPLPLPLKFPLVLAVVTLVEATGIECLASATKELSGNGTWALLCGAIALSSKRIA